MQSSLKATSLPFRFFALCFIAAAALSLAPGKIHAQCGGVGQKSSVTSSGTEFLVCFMQNDRPSDNQNEYQDIYIAGVDLTSQDVDTVTISCKRYPALNRVFYLTAQNPSQVWRENTDTEVTGDGIINSSDTVDIAVFHVLATSPTTCYGMNNKFTTADAFLSFPKNVAGPDYVIMSYPSSNLSGQEMPSEFCVAAFEDHTSFVITPTAPVQNKNWQGDTIGEPQISKLTPLHFVINAGECVQIQAIANDQNYDLTGSTIKVDSPFKPVAVYAGHARADVPVNFADPSGGGVSRDHLAEAMPPLKDWGTYFLTSNFSLKDNRPDGDIMRVLSSTDGDTVKINGKVWGNAFKQYEYRDTLIVFDQKIKLNNIAAVESTKPILVGMVAHTAVTVNGGTLGDPFSANVPPLNQVWNDYTYFISEDFKDFNQGEQYIVVVTEQSNTGNIKIDSTLILSNFFTNVPTVFQDGKTYAIATIGQSDGGIHKISCPSNSGFTILAYGWGTLTSYGYTAGLLFKPITGIMSLPSPTHSIVPNPGHQTLPPPSIVIRDITNERVYFDSVKVTYTQNTQNNTVRLKKDLVMDVGFMESAQEITQELTTSQPVTDVITGSMRIWYHSPKWFDMYPVDFPFTITPQQAAGVNDQNVQSAFLENYPNPSTGRTTVHFWLPSRASVSVKIYDALGRTIRTVMQGMTNGEETLQVSTKGLPAGDYTLELLAPELGISKHSHVVVVE